MRYSDDHKAATHTRIVRTAANELRAHGIDGIGVAALMSKAGLTHGGFYAHFESKDALLAEAIDAACEDTFTRLQKLGESTPAAERVDAIADAYLNTAHRDRPDRGCAIAALGGEIARLPPKLRGQFEQRIEALLSLLDDDTDTNRELAIQRLSTMVGALLLARAVRSKTFSNEILEAARAAI
jgi:TetR/AcrR family transcriptional repressor of nem operon